MLRSRVSSMLAPALVAALLAAPVVLMPVSPASAQIAVDITIAPPELPVYEQPPLPAPGYIWTPGFWSYGDDGYYWVPGTWVEPPQPGLLWTPGYWGWNNGRYAFNQGYWGPHVGFYGGINYGYGYTGNGFEGGEWRGREFAYNRAVNNFGNVHVTNVYERNVTDITNVRRVSFNGPNGVNARPTPEQERWNHEQHVQLTEAQQQHRQAAAQNRELRASVNHGDPAIKATSRPGDFSSFRSTPAPANRGPQADEHRAGAPGPHMENGPHPALAPHPDAGARPNAAMRQEHGPRTEAAPHPEAAHGPEAARRPEAASRPEVGPRPEATPRPAVNPHPSAPGREGGVAPRPEGAMHAMAPHPAEAPHPAAAPHPAEGGHPGDEKH